MTQLTLLDSNRPEFPPCDFALDDPDGLLAVGGNLQPETLVKAYQCGIFPWFSDGEPIMWWSPEARAIILPKQFHVSRSLTRFIRKAPYQLTHNQAFDRVVYGCSKPRKDDEGTWITADMADAYSELNKLGHAHSVEVWDNNRLVGGVYGIVIGSIFCGESMFSDKLNASKLALNYIVNNAKGLTMIDCQIPNPHLKSLGSTVIPRSDFIQALKKSQHQKLIWLESN